MEVSVPNDGHEVRCHRFIDGPSVCTSIEPTIFCHARANLRGEREIHPTFQIEYMRLFVLFLGILSWLKRSKLQLHYIL